MFGKWFLLFENSCSKWTIPNENIYKLENLVLICKSKKYNNKWIFKKVKNQT